MFESERGLERQRIPLPEMTITPEEQSAVFDDPDHTATDVLILFRKDLNELYTANAGTIERYTLAQHTRMVLTQYMRYFSDKSLPNIERSFFETVLALHDIGKPYAAKEGNMNAQYEYTAVLLRHILPQLGYANEEVEKALSLVEGDPLREYLYRRDSDIDAIAEDIRARAERAQMNVENFWDLLLIYWMSDAGSYTVNAGGKASLDRMFEFDTDGNEMHLAPHIEGRIQKLKGVVLANDVVDETHA